MTENHLLTQIQEKLAHPAQNLEALFCETLLWGRAQGPAFTRQVTLAPGQTVNLEIRPLAQLSGLPVFRVDWPSEKPPTLLQRRSVHRALAASYVEHLLVYVTRDGQQAAFVWARRRGEGKIELRTLPYTVGLPARTTLEQLGKLAFSLEELGLFGDPGRSAVTDKLDAAFDVEAVTKRFFRDYRLLFEQAEASIDLPWSAEQKRLYTQRFFNRLLFLAFLERKGWLTFNGRKDYLRALFEDYLRNDPEKRRSANFHRKRLNALFFMGLNNPYGRDLLQSDPQYAAIRALIGEVPYLNGGLFEREADDETFFFPDDLLARILADLLYRYNFTVTESTPLDVEVAVDPEMLGKIFEELVTGRHESGSYYTPKPVVQFMCREALKSYLETALPAERADSIARFVDEDDGAALRDPEAALAALKQVKVCDPACGSGAYLLGMLHELLEKREALFAARRLDAQTLYQRKLEIIQNALYGVDLDPFAVNIARLRLWLSLIVDYEGYPPPPLPNLDFKIEAGDSLTAPDPSGGLQPDLFRYGQVQEFLRLKNEYMSVHTGSDEKKKLLAQIEDLKAQIKAWAHVGQVSDLPDAFDWQVEFAEVFAPSLTPTRPFGSPSPNSQNVGRAGEQGKGGFDILLANPPYVRQELIKDLKPALKRVYGPLFTGTADLYVYFYLRAHQLLKEGGTMVFISSNKYFRSAYGETLRAFLGKYTRLRYLIDFGDSPIFQAIAYPSILVAQKSAPDETHQFQALAWKSNAPLEQFDEARQAQTFLMPQSDLTPAAWRLEDRATLRLLDKLRRAGTPLGEYVQGRFYRGIVTGLNEAFVVDRATRDRLIAEHPSSAEVLKPFLRGRDVKRWRVEHQDLWLIFTRRGIDIQKYPAILHYLEQFKGRLMPGVPGGRKPGSYQWYEIQDNIAYWQEFEQPKIVWGNLTTQPNFSFAQSGFYISAPANLIVSDSPYLLGILNSKIAEFWVSQSGAQRQGGFLEYKPMYVSPIPIPPRPADEQITALVERILAAKRADPQADVSEWEREIDRLVYALYGLTEEEITIVEGKA